MSLLKKAINLKAINPLIQPKRNRGFYGYGFEGGFIPGKWGGVSHVTNGPPMVRWPFWQKMAVGTVWVGLMFTYPLYITYMMYEWDLLDKDL